MPLYTAPTARCHPEQGEGTEPVREGSPSFVLAWTMFEAYYTLMMRSTF